MGEKNEKKGEMLKAGSVWVHPAKPAHYIWTGGEETIVNVKASAQWASSSSTLLTIRDKNSSALLPFLASAKLLRVPSQRSDAAIGPAQFRLHVRPPSSPPIKALARSRPLRSSSQLPSQPEMRALNSARRHCEEL
jgi:hypothetical protein